MQHINDVATIRWGIEARTMSCIAATHLGLLRPRMNASFEASLEKGIERVVMSNYYRYERMFVLRFLQIGCQPL